MTLRKIAYLETALLKRKAINKDIKERYSKERADKYLKYISKILRNERSFQN